MSKKDFVKMEQNNKNCKISLLIPTYNSENTLQKTFDSIKRQRFLSREVIIIDGGSIDSTLKIIEENKDLISVVVSESDNGIYDAINKGLDLAKGTLITVLGSDDELCPNALELVFSAWNASKADIVAGQAVMVATDGTESMRIDEDYGNGALLSGIPFCHNAMFVTREAYKRVGDYDLRYRICADANWVHRAILLGCTCKKIDEPVVRFSLGGVSSISDIEIMSESYQVIVNNFPEISMEDAERMLYAIRGWSDDSKVNSILYKYRHNSHFIKAAIDAFDARLHRLGTTAPLLVAAAELGSAPALLHRTRFTNYVRQFVIQKLLSYKK